MIFQAHQSFENLPGDSKSFPPKSWDFSAQKTHRKIWLRKPTTEYQQCFWETSLSIEVFEWFVLKSLVHEIVISITLWPFVGKSGLPIAILGCANPNFLPSNHQIHRYLSSNKTYKVLGAFGGRVSFWKYTKNLQGCFSWCISKIKALKSLEG